MPTILQCILEMATMSVILEIIENCFQMKISNVFSIARIKFAKHKKKKYIKYF